MTSIRQLKGIGVKTEELFFKVGVTTIQELLQYYPRDYDTYGDCVRTDEVRTGEVFAVKATISKTPEIARVKHLQIISTVIQDAGGTLSLVWYNMPFLQKTLKRGMQYIFRGRIIYKNKKMVMEQPQMYTLSAYEELLHSMQPVYALTKGLSNSAVAKAVRKALEDGQCRMYKEYIPSAIRKKYELAEYNFAVENIHFPGNRELMLTARKRLVFEEFFIFILALQRLKEVNEFTKNKYPMRSVSLVVELAKRLPYNLTGAQKNVWEEIKADLAGEKAMNRLVQGDVGSGKTIIAVFALLTAALNGYQGAMMVPTEVLARQHYESISELLQTYEIPVKAVLLTGSMTAKEKRLAYEKIEAHEADIVIGTHALIQEKVNYHNLSLVVTDEQHRFGVNQRRELAEKGSREEAIHVLAMSATPIPRTLAVILYGDMDISVIDELPANRLPIKNCVVATDYRQKAYRFIEDEVKKGRQAYIICSMVEETEHMDGQNVIDYTQTVRASISPNICVDYLHGKMKGKEKNERMERFARNEIQILVSTTVVEVGVNVPNATVMMVEDAQRFGLAQLHQLRGRVGRGKEQSYCIFVCTSDKKEAMDRLLILNKSNDGFFIAGEDLKLRGPGDLMGIRQSGIMEFKLADVFSDSAALKEAREAAELLLKEDAMLEKEENRELSKYLSTYIEDSLCKIEL